DAAFAAVCAIAGVEGRIVSLDMHHLAEYEVGPVHAQAVVAVGEHRFTGLAREVDVADAAVSAFVAAINQAVALETAQAA
ncbi:MAG: hypothetical protein WD076_09680, partial [Parvularculaceae bacterium]